MQQLVRSFFQRSCYATICNQEAPLNETSLKTETLSLSEGEGVVKNVIVQESNCGADQN